jgi:iron complex transport system ATP-binding protein
LELIDVGVVRSGVWLLKRVTWTVREGERWVVVGANGTGKTTLISIASSYLRPSRGSVSILGHQVGRVDVRILRRFVGLASSALADRIPTNLTAAEATVAGATGAMAPWWDAHGPETYAKAERLLERVGCGSIRDRRYDCLSSGERQRILIARALMLDPALLLLDEPAAGLDLGGREMLASLLGSLNADPRLAAMVVVTHHIEEIPPGTSHALVLSAGRVLASGPIAAVLTSDVLSRAFGLELAVEQRGDRYTARAKTVEDETQTRSDWVGERSAVTCRG